jgi:serine/threonine protein kinase
LDHPNIINIFEIWEWQKMLFLVTDFCRGSDLLSYVLNRDNLGEKEVKIIMRQCMYTLNYLHSQGICHRDIKLENIMLVKPNDLSHIKLIDFGLSKEV